MGGLSELDITGPVLLVLNAPALQDQAQQRACCCTQAADEPKVDHSARPAPGGGGQFHDPGTAGPMSLDMLWCHLGLELPSGVAPVAVLEIV